MRSAGGALAFVVATLLVYCSAEPHQDQDVSGTNHNSITYDAGIGHKSLALEPASSNNLAREVREIRPSGYVPYPLSRRYEFSSPYGGKREQWPLAPVEYGGYYGDGLPKRNFDEIDRSGMDTFVKKRNFDEIDRSSMPFPFKRFYHLSSFDKKRNRADYPMDEIDFSHFPIGSKRSQDYPLLHNL